MRLLFSPLPLLSHLAKSDAGHIQTNLKSNFPEEKRVRMIMEGFEIFFIIKGIHRRAPEMKI